MQVNVNKLFLIEHIKCLKVSEFRSNWEVNYIGFRLIEVKEAVNNYG